MYLNFWFYNIKQTKIIFAYLQIASRWCLRTRPNVVLSLLHSCCCYRWISNHTGSTGFLPTIPWWVLSFPRDPWARRGWQHLASNGSTMLDCCSVAPNLTHIVLNHTLPRSPQSHPKGSRSKLWQDQRIKLSRSRSLVLQFHYLLLTISLIPMHPMHLFQLTL